MPTCKVVLDNPASSLALNSDFTQVVIAGSHIFKIFSIGDSELTEKANLYAAKNHSPNFSSSDVVWNPIEENKLATVATNGAVVIWDLNKSTRSKLDMVFKDHERPVNKVSFHPLEPSLLISGLQGGLMKLFDTRRKEAVTTFISNTESVRDIQFSPHSNYYFAAGTENGNVQIWDRRRSDHIEHHFTEHRGPVFALDWHPEYRLWIATASRDHTIKVWDLNKPLNMYNSIKTVGSVWRVKWRPDKHYHLASCALAVDCSISVWDINRPYLPFSAFHEHRDLTTGIAWQGKANVLLSVGKDSTLYYHAIEDATHPIENTNPVSLSVNPRGLIAASKPKNGVNGCPSSFRHPCHREASVSTDSFGPVCSSMSVFDFTEESPVSAEHILESAVGYRLTGRALGEVCEHNAAVAKRLNRSQVAMTWQIVQLLFDGPSATSTDFSQGVISKEDPRAESALDSDPKHVRHVSGEGAGDTSIGTGAASAEEGDTETDDTDTHDVKLMHIVSGVMAGNDYFSCDDEISQLTFDYENLSTVDTNPDWILPTEAFQPRRDIIYRSTTPPEDFSSSTPLQKEETGHLSSQEEGRLLSGAEYVMADSLWIIEGATECPPPMDFTPLIADIMHHYAAMGDVQMAVTLRIVLGDRGKNLVDDVTVEHWFLSYIELLHRLHLWDTATEIIQYGSGYPHVQEMNQQSVVKLQCGSCNEGISKRFCRKCGKVPSRCAVCHNVVNGLFVWCQGCSHGGHLIHMMEWIKNNSSCPTGCGHLCEYS